MALYLETSSSKIIALLNLLLGIYFINPKAILTFTAEKAQKLIKSFNWCYISKRKCFFF